MAALAAPPHHGARVGVKVLGAQAAAQIGVELPGDVRSLRSEVVAALGEIMHPSPWHDGHLRLSLRAPRRLSRHSYPHVGHCSQVLLAVRSETREGFRSPSRNACTVI